MVRAETIRKGSKVFMADSLREPLTVEDNINGEIILKLNKIVKANANDLYPVPLTEENIVRCGFYKTDAYSFEHPIEKVELEIDHTGITNMYVHTHKTKVALKAVHELQHAFWTYTNKEINFK